MDDEDDHGEEAEGGGEIIYQVSCSCGRRLVEGQLAPTYVFGARNSAFLKQRGPKKANRDCLAVVQMSGLREPPSASGARERRNITTNCDEESWIEAI